MDYPPNGKYSTQKKIFSDKIVQFFYENVDNGLNIHFSTWVKVVDRCPYNMYGQSSCNICQSFKV